MRVSLFCSILPVTIQFAQFDSHLKRILLPIDLDDSHLLLIELIFISIRSYRGCIFSLSLRLKLGLISTNLFSKVTSVILIACSVILIASSYWHSYSSKGIIISILRITKLWPLLLMKINEISICLSLLCSFLSSVPNNSEHNNESHQNNR